MVREIWGHVEVEILALEQEFVAYTRPLVVPRDPVAHILVDGGTLALDVVEF